MDVRYPLGRFVAKSTLTAAERRDCIDRIALAPQELRLAVAGLNDNQLDTPYRDGGWTPRQVIHHVPDSHMNAYLRFKWALTEDEPTIKPYDEVAWALLSDVKGTPVDTSLRLLAALHERWVILLRTFTEAEWNKRFVHPESGILSLEQAVASYAWHGSHHAAHITALRSQHGW